LIQLSPERKLDVLGVILALVGLVTLLSLLSSSQGSFTGAWLELLLSCAGWGTFVLPIGLLLIGLWLVLRNVDRLPRISAERLVGAILLYLNLLGWVHLLYGGGWDLAAAGQGGGYLGALVERLLTGALGVAGSIVVLVGWFLVALTMTLDISIPDLFRLFRPLVNKLDNARKSPAKPVHTAHPPAN